MKHIIHRYSQNTQEFYNVVLPYSEIEKSSYVMEYGEFPLGYQRKLDKKHVKNISNTLLKDKEILPTSIILSINQSDLSKINLVSVPGLGNHFFEMTIPDEKIFRIVDGQHRLEGLKVAKESNFSFNDYQLNVVILVTNTGNSSLEVEIFRDINSKAKKLKTDLTQLSLYNHRLRDKKKIESSEELTEHLSIRVAHFINESSKEHVVFENNPWINGIIFDIHEENPLGIIGVSAFIKSISTIVKKYIDHEIQLKGIINLSVYEEGIIREQLDSHAYILANLLVEAWTIVKNEWKECFSEKIVTEGNQIKYYYYNKSYYLQKTTGVNAIHSVLYDSLVYQDLIIHKGNYNLSNFHEIIKESQVNGPDWIIGGFFAGMTSQSGFKKAKNYITNEIKMQRERE